MVKVEAITQQFKSYYKGAVWVLKKRTVYIYCY